MSFDVALIREAVAYSRVAWGNELLAACDEIERLREALSEYAGHQTWRCQYRSRYGSCVCGLDELMDGLGLPPVLVIDPEQAAPKQDGEASKAAKGPKA